MRIVLAQVDSVLGEVDQNFERARDIVHAQAVDGADLVARLGRPSVPHATAVGKVLLAHTREMPRRPLASYTDHTITDLDVLAAEVALTAERGWAESVGEREADLNAIAVPAVSGEGDLRAILGLQGPAARFDSDSMQAAVRLLLDSAAAISMEWAR